MVNYEQQSQWVTLKATPLTYHLNSVYLLVCMYRDIVGSTKLWILSRIIDENEYIV